MALEVYVDDSGSHGGPVYLLAGFIGRAEQWAQFKVEWKAALANPEHQSDGRLRAIDYFKAKQANGLRGQFSGWSSDARDRKVMELTEIAKRFSISGVYSGLMHADYKKTVLAVPGWQLRSPYFFLCHAVMAAVLNYLEREGIDEPVDFIFDEQQGQGKLVQRAYDTFFDVAKPTFKNMLRNRPTHRSDISHTPIQAADLLAWSVRRWIDEKSQGCEFNNSVMTALRSMPQQEDGWSRSRLENYVRAWQRQVEHGALSTVRRDGTFESLPR